MHTTQPQFIWLLIAGGSVLTGCGLLYVVPFVQRIDHSLFMLLHLRLVRQSPFFRMIWPMGKTPFMVTMLGILYFTGLSSGFRATIVFPVAFGLPVSILIFCVVLLCLSAWDVFLLGFISHWT